MVEERVKLKNAVELLKRTFGPVCEVVIVHFSENADPVISGWNGENEVQIEGAFFVETHPDLVSTLFSNDEQFCNSVVSFQYGEVNFA